MGRAMRLSRAQHQVGSNPRRPKQENCQEMQPCRMLGAALDGGRQSRLVRRCKVRRSRPSPEAGIEKRAHVDARLPVFRLGQIFSLPLYPDCLAINPLFLTIDCLIIVAFVLRHTSSCMTRCFVLGPVISRVVCQPPHRSVVAHLHRLPSALHSLPFHHLPSANSPCRRFSDVLCL
ncbi:hypothetical protein VTN96DRAFT_3274 [Rasamsonia emersonii]